MRDLAAVPEQEPVEPGAAHFRLLAALALLGVIAGLRSAWLLCGLGAAMLVRCLAGGANGRRMLARMGMVAAGGAWFGLLVALDPGGAPDRAALVFLRVLAAATVLGWLQTTLGTRNLFAALYRLGMPSLMLHQLLFTWRYCHLLREEVLALRCAAEARGFSAGKGLWSRRTFDLLGHLAGALLLRALARGQRVSLAVAARGVGDCPPLVVFRSRPQGRELAACLAGVAAAVAVWWLDRGGSWLIALFTPWK